MKKTIWIAGAALALMGLAGCDGGPSAVAARDHSQTASVAAEAPRETVREQTGGTVERVATPMVDGKPLWSATSRYSADENARRAFERNGEAFGADDLEAFVKKAHAFVESPPKGAETLKRANGDTLIYDAASNTFAVVTKAGAPRTMFKPDAGAAYWEEQKTRESQRADRPARNDRG